MFGETRITLPGAETMMARLKEVNDEPHLVEKFFPRLTEHAGKERVPMGVIMMLQLAIHDYTKGMPAVMVAMLNMDMERYIDALVLDETAASVTKARWAKVLERGATD